MGNHNSSELNAIFDYVKTHPDLKPEVKNYLLSLSDDVIEIEKNVFGYDYTQYIMRVEAHIETGFYLSSYSTREHYWKIKTGNKNIPMPDSYKPRASIVRANISPSCVCFCTHWDNRNPFKMKVIKKIARELNKHYNENLKTFCYNHAESDYRFDNILTNACYHEIIDSYNKNTNSPIIKPLFRIQKSCGSPCVSYKRISEHTFKGVYALYKGAFRVKKKFLGYIVYIAGEKPIFVLK